MKGIVLGIASVAVSGPAMACAFAGYETLSGQIADDINRVYTGQIDTSCTVTRSSENRFRCSIGCTDFKAHFSTKDGREKYLAIVTAATQKSLGEVVPGDFVRLSVMDGYMASKNTVAQIDIQASRRVWSGSSIKGSKAFARFAKKIAALTTYDVFMTTKPMQPLD